MAFGISDAGLTIKRISDIRTELQSGYRSVFRDTLTVSEDSRFGQLIDIQAERESILWELFESLYNSAYRDTSTGASLDEAASRIGAKRQIPLSSAVDVYAAGDALTVIPENSEFGILGFTTVFSSLTEVTLGSIGELSVLSITRVATVATVTSTSHGFIESSFVFIVDADQIEYNGLFQVTNVTVNTFDYTVADSPITPATGSILAQEATAIKTQATETGAIVALSGVITEILTAVSGLNTILNAEDALVGRNAETDSEFRARANLTLQALGQNRVETISAALKDVPGVAGAEVFENDTGLVDSFGRPAHSFEAIVSGTFSSQEVIDTIFSKKAAGIQAFGSINGTSLDSFGILHDIGYSVATLIPIFIVIIIDKGALFPIDGPDKIKTSLAAFGDTILIGETLIVNPDLTSTIPTDIDIVDYSISISKTAIIAGSISGVVRVGPIVTATATAHGLSDGSLIKVLGADQSGYNEEVCIFNVTTNTFDYAIPSEPVTPGTGTIVFYPLFNDNISASQIETLNIDSSNITVIEI